MNKLVKDGKVAVLYSPGFGAGWYSWHQREELVFDPALVELVLRQANKEEIEKYCKATYGENVYLGGAYQLEVEWIPEGSAFEIREYDGAEWVETKDSITWLTA